MCNYAITLQTSEDEQHIDPLLNLTFGEGRVARPSYSLRVGVAPITELCFVVKSSDGELLATLRFWPVSIEGEEALLLGPLAVQPKLQGKGIGRALVAEGLAKARKMGYRLCFVVGEQVYYSPYDFKLAHPLGYDMPVPVSEDKFQVISLQRESFAGLPKGVMQLWLPTSEHVPSKKKA
ncbi:MAG: N-acetyltransferase [Halopseudomonas aestusnigri]